MAVASDLSTVVIALECCDNIYRKHARILITSVSTYTMKVLHTLLWQPPIHISCQMWLTRHGVLILIGTSGTVPMTVSRNHLDIQCQLIRHGRLLTLDVHTKQFFVSCGSRTSREPSRDPSTAGQASSDGVLPPPPPPAPGLTQRQPRSNQVTRHWSFVEAFSLAG